MREVLSVEAPFKPGESPHVWGVEQKGHQKLRHIEQGWRLYSEIRQKSLTRTAIDKAC